MKRLMVVMLLALAPVAGAQVEPTPEFCRDPQNWKGNPSYDDAGSMRYIYAGSGDPEWEGPHWFRPPDGCPNSTYPVGYSTGLVTKENRLCQYTSKLYWHNPPPTGGHPGSNDICWSRPWGGDCDEWVDFQWAGGSPSATFMVPCNGTNGCTTPTGGGSCAGYEAISFVQTKTGPSSWEGTYWYYGEPCIARPGYCGVSDAPPAAPAP